MRAPGTFAATAERWSWPRRPSRMLVKMPDEQPPRQQPTILITGTPGTGKSTHAALLAQQSQLKHINIGDLVKEKGLHEGFDEEWQSYTVDEDKVCRVMASRQFNAYNLKL